MDRKIFKYLFDKHKQAMATIVFTEIILLVGFWVTTLHNSYENAWYFNLSDLTGIALMSAGGLCVLTPIYLYKYVHSRSESDRMMALPFSRKEMFWTTQYFIWSFISVLFVGSLFLAVVLTSLHSMTLNVLLDLGILLVIMMVGIPCMTLLTTTLYLLGNTLVDGVVIIGGYFALPLFILLAAAIFDGTFVVGFSPVSSFLGGKVSYIYTWAEVAINQLAYARDTHYLFFAISTLVHLVICVWAVNKLYMERKSECATQQSTRMMGYPFLFTSYLFILCTAIPMTESDINGIGLSIIILYALVFVGYMTFVCIYKRKITVTFKEVGIFLAALVVGFAFTIVAHVTNGFNLSYAYNKTAEPIYYDYNAYYDFSDWANDGRNIQRENEIGKILYDKGIETDYAEVYFDIIVNDREAMKDLVDLFENERIKCIKYGQSHEWSYARGSINITDNYYQKPHVKNGIVDYSETYYTQLYHYGLSDKDCFTIEELKLASKYAEVIIDFYDNKKESYQNITLEELLAQ